MLKNYLQLVRFPAVFTAISNILSAFFVINAGTEKIPIALLLMLTSGLIYMSGMILNDIFDYNEDLKQQPFRPIPSGIVSLKNAQILASIFLISAISISAYVGLTQLYLALALIIAVFLYDMYLKNTMFRSITMASCRYLNWSLGLSLASITGVTLLLPIPILLYIYGLTLLSANEVGKFESTSVHLSFLFIVFSFLSIIIMIIVLQFNYSAILITLVLLYFIVNNYITVYRNRDVKSIKKMVSLLIFCIIPLDATLVFAVSDWWQGIIVLVLIIPMRLLGKSLYVT